MVLKLGQLRKVVEKYLESFEMWCWRRMEKISWTDRVRNEEVLLDKESRRRGISHIQENEERLIVLVTCYVGTVFYSTLP